MAKSIKDAMTTKPASLPATSTVADAAQQMRDRDIGDVLGIDGASGIGEALAAHITELAARLGLPTRLSQAGVPEDGIPALVEGAMGDATTLLNPREMGEEDYEALYKAAL